MKHYFGVDVGTYETKGVLVDEAGEIVATAARGHQMIVPRPGWAEHRPEEDWWGDFVLVCREVLATSGVDPSSIRGVGCSAIGPCMLPVDGGGAPLMNAVLYGVDVRSMREVGELTARIGADRILDLCGNALTSQSVGPKILWLKRERPELFAKAEKIVTSTSFLVHKLTGVWAVDHYTAANTSPLYLADERRYSDMLADDIVPLDRLPKPVWTTDVVGGITKKAAADTGLAEGTPVIAGTIDAAAEALSVGVAEPGDMMLMYGSTIFIISPTAERIRDSRLWYAPWLFEGQHASMAGLATSGTLTHWFRDQFAKELGRDDAFAALAAEAAASPPGANGLVVLPYFSGERTPIHDPCARGVVFGLDLTHTRGDVYRAMIEGIAYGTNHVVEAFTEVGAAPSRVFAVGGGVKNSLWTQATSDISRLSQTVRRRTIGAAYGDAFLAAVGVGDASVVDIAAWNPTEREISPTHEATTRAGYDLGYDVFKKLYLSTKHLMAELSDSDDAARG